MAIGTRTWDTNSTAYLDVHSLYGVHHCHCHWLIVYCSVRYITQSQTTRQETNMKESVVLVEIASYHRWNLDTIISYHRIAYLGGYRTNYTVQQCH